MADIKTSYAALNAVLDPATRQVLKFLFDKVGALEQQQAAATVAATTTQVDGHSQRVVQVGDPTIDTDAVNLQTLKRYVAGATAAAPPTPPLPHA